MKFNAKILPLAFLTFMAINALNVENAVSDENLPQKAKETGNDIKRGTKKAVRKVKDETCELVNGKMECAAQKVKHKVQNAIE